MPERTRSSALVGKVPYNELPPPTRLMLWGLCLGLSLLAAGVPVVVLLRLAGVL